jgi:uncharacterized protein (TIGR00369 family)
MSEPRTRTVTWSDPVAIAENARGKTGLEFIREIQSGRVPAPPIAVLLGFDLEEASEGRAVFGVVPAEYHYNPIGVVHGGLAATLLDSAMGCAVQSQLPAGRAYTTLEFKVNLVRAITKETGKLRSEGKVVHVGKTTATAEGRLVDAAGKLYAHATTTCLIFDLPSERPSR